MYADALWRTARGLALFDVPLLIAGGIAAYVLARVSVHPLITAREREAQFAAEAAHELRTPLARIASIAQSAQSAPDPRVLEDALRRIAALAVDASGIVGDLLALVREERVAPRLSEPVDLGAVVQAAAASPREARAELVLTRDGPRWVTGDERRLRRLVDNLLDNAQRHARERVLVSVVSDATTVALTVEDDGDGVPLALRERIFERFVRAHDDEGGSGLGLAICREIARAHGGDIALEECSRFVVRLPRIDTG